MSNDFGHDKGIEDMKERIAGLTGQNRMEYLLGLNDGIMTCAALVRAASDHPKIVEFLQYVHAQQGKALEEKLKDDSHP